MKYFRPNFQTEIFLDVAESNRQQIELFLEVICSISSLILIFKYSILVGTFRYTLDFS